VTIDIFSRRFVACCIEDAKTFCRSFFDWYNQGIITMLASA
jgi:hypothetical protein